MDANLVDKIKNSAEYKELTTKRSAFAWKLSIIMLIIYYAFILTIAFAPTLLGVKIGSGVTTIGIPIGIIIIIAAFSLTGIYTKRANSEYDALIKKIKDDVKRESA